ncbi:MAG: hypothetical protein AB7K09_03275 [Planctomycetota bacterium]
MPDDFLDPKARRTTRRSDRVERGDRSVWATTRMTRFSLSLLLALLAGCASDVRTNAAAAPAPDRSGEAGATPQEQCARIVERMRETDDARQLRAAAEQLLQLRPASDRDLREIWHHCTDVECRRIVWRAMPDVARREVLGTSRYELADPLQREVLVGETLTTFAGRKDLIERAVLTGLLDEAGNVRAAAGRVLAEWSGAGRPAAERLARALLADRLSPERESWDALVALSGPHVGWLLRNLLWGSHMPDEVRTAALRAILARDGVWSETLLSALQSRNPLVAAAAGDFVTPDAIREATTGDERVRKVAFRALCSSSRVATDDELFWFSEVDDDIGNSALELLLDRAFCPGDRVLIARLHDWQLAHPAQEELAGRMEEEFAALVERDILLVPPVAREAAIRSSRSMLADALRAVAAIDAASDDAARLSAARRLAARPHGLTYHCLLRPVAHLLTRPDIEHAAQGESVLELLLGIVVEWGFAADDVEFLETRNAVISRFDDGPPEWLLDDWLRALSTLAPDALVVRRAQVLAMCRDDVSPELESSLLATLPAMHDVAPLDESMKAGIRRWVLRAYDRQYAGGWPPLRRLREVENAVGVVGLDETAVADWAGRMNEFPLSDRPARAAKLLRCRLPLSPATALVAVRALLDRKATAAMLDAINRCIKDFLHANAPWDDPRIRQYVDGLFDGMVRREPASHTLQFAAGALRGSGHDHADSTVIQALKLVADEGGQPAADAAQLIRDLLGEGDAGR